MTISGIGIDILSGYLTARANLRAGGVNPALGIGTGSNSSSRNTPLPPWDPRQNPAPNDELAKKALSGKKFIDLEAAKLGDRNIDKDYNKMFALHTALRTLSAINEAASKKNLGQDQLSRLTKRFNEGTAEVDTFLRGLKMDKAKLVKGQIADKLESKVQVKRDAPYYSTGVLHVGAGDAEVARFAGPLQFKVTATKNNGDVVSKNIDLAGMGSTTRNMNNVANFINGELESAGIVSRFVRQEIVDPKADPKKISTTPKQWAFKINGSVTEKISFSAVAGNTDSNITVAATEINVTNKTNTIGRISGYNEAEGTSASIVNFTKDVATTSGTMNVRASATGADGSTFVIADITGDVNGQTIKGTRDVALIKYDSAGNTVFTRTLGAAEDAQGFAVAVGSDGSIAVAGSVIGKLTSSDIGYKNDSYVAKFNADGEEEWARRRGSVLDDEATAVAIADDGSVIVGGRTKASLNGENMLGGYDNYIRKYDDTGALVFTDQFGSSADDKITSIGLLQASVGSSGGGGGAEPDVRDEYLTTFHDATRTQAETAASLAATVQASNSNYGNMVDYQFDADGNMWGIFENDGTPGQNYMLKVNSSGTVIAGTGYSFGASSGVNDAQVVLTGTHAYYMRATSSQDVTYSKFDLSYNYVSGGSLGYSFESLDDVIVDDSDNLHVVGTRTNGDKAIMQVRTSDNSYTIGSFTPSGTFNINSLTVEDGATYNGTARYIISGNDGAGTGVIKDVTTNAGTVTNVDDYSFANSDITNATIYNGTVYTYGSSTNTNLDPDFDAGDDGGAVSLDTHLVYAHSGSGSNPFTAWLDTAEGDESGVAYFDPVTGDPGTPVENGGGGGGGGGGGVVSAAGQSLYVAGVENGQSVIRTFTFENDATSPTAGAVYNLGDLGGGVISAVRGASDAIYVAGTTTQSSLQFQADGVNITTRLSNAASGGQDGFVARIDMGSNNAAVAFVGSSADEIVSSMVLTGVTATAGTPFIPGDPGNPGTEVVIDDRDTNLVDFHGDVFTPISDISTLHNAIVGNITDAEAVMDGAWDESGTYYYAAVRVHDVNVIKDSVKIIRADASGNIVTTYGGTMPAINENTNARVDYENGELAVAYTMRPTVAQTTYLSVSKFDVSNPAAITTSGTPHFSLTNAGSLVEAVEISSTGNILVASAYTVLATKYQVLNEVDLVGASITQRRNAALTDNTETVTGIAEDDLLTGSDQRYFLVGTNSSGSAGMVRQLDTVSGITSSSGIWSIDGSTGITKLDGNAEVINGQLYLTGNTESEISSVTYDAGANGSIDNTLTVREAYTYTGGAPFSIWIDAVDRDESAVGYFDDEGVAGELIGELEGYVAPTPDTPATGGGTSDAEAIYVGGSTGGTMAGQTKIGTQDGFFTKLTFDGTDLNIEYNNQFGRAGTRMNGVQIGVADGSADLAKLGLPTGEIDYSDSQRVEAASSARAGDHFFVKVNNRSAIKVTMEANDTMRTLAAKVQRLLSIDGKAEARLTDKGTALKITANKGDRIELIAGAKGQDLLRALNLSEGLVMKEVKDNKGNVIDQSGPSAYALKLPAQLRIDTEAERKKTADFLSYAISTVQRSYRESKLTPEEKAAQNEQNDRIAKSSGTVSPYMQNQIANYQQALARLSGGGGGITGLF